MANSHYQPCWQLKQNYLVILPTDATQQFLWKLAPFVSWIALNALMKWNHHHFLKGKQNYKIVIVLCYLPLCTGCGRWVCHHSRFQHLPMKVAVLGMIERWVFHAQQSFRGLFHAPPVHETHYKMTCCKGRGHSRKERACGSCRGRWIMSHCGSRFLANVSLLDLCINLEHSSMQTGLREQVTRP